MYKDPVLNKVVEVLVDLDLGRGREHKIQHPRNMQIENQYDKPSVL